MLLAQRVDVAETSRLAKVNTMQQGAVKPSIRPTVLPQPHIAQPAPTQAATWQTVTSQSVPVAQVAARAAIVVNNDTGEVLQAKNADQPLPEASITKLMTAFVVMDKMSSMDQLITVSARAAATPPTNLPLGEGEQLTVHELLDALLLPSANDAANALADGFGGEDAFVAAMNAKAASLGLKHTHFGDATGFDTPGHAASAADLATLAHDLFAVHPEVLQIMQQPTLHLDANDHHKAYYLVNFHPLVSSYPGFVGGKPGFTGDAGMCLLTLAQRDGKSVLAVVLNSPDYAGESRTLLDGGFAMLK